MTSPQTTLLSVTAATAICFAGLFPGPARAAPHEAASTAASAVDATAQWAPVGPNGQAGAITRALGAPDRAILIPAFGIGPWITDDGGSTWRQLPDPPGVRNLGDANRVLLDPADPTHWWYAGTAAASEQSVLLETHDDGRTWTESMRFEGTLLAVLQPTEPSKTILATTTGPTTATVHTRDGQHPWTAQPIDTGEEIRHITATDGALVLRGFFAMWRLDDPGSGTAPVEIYRVEEEARRAVDAALDSEAGPLGVATSDPDEDDGQIWDMASTASVILVRELGRGIVGSTDGGASWVDWPLAHGVDAITSEGDALYLVRSDGTARAVDVTTDAGASFTEIPLPQDGAINHEFTTWDDGSITTANPRSGLYRTTDGGKRWERVGVQGTSGLDLLVHNDRLFSGTEYGLASTTVPITDHEWGITGGEARVGTTVPELDSAGGDEPLWRAVNAAFNVLDVQSSSDGGRTWEGRSSLFGSATGLMAHPADPNTIVMAWHNGQQCGLHTSHDGGETWGTKLGDCFDAVVGDPRDPKRVWLGGPSGLFRSDDGGRTGVKVSDIPSTTILLDKHRLIIGGDELHTSEDDGATFTKSTEPSSVSTAADAQFTSLVRSGPRVFAGFTTGVNTSDSGVLLSTDSGRTWTDFSTGIQNSEVLSLELGPGGDSLFAGTRNGGVHMTPLPPRVAPTALSDRVETRAGEPVKIDVLANDSGGDLDIDPGTVAVRLGDGPVAEWASSLQVDGEGRFDVDAATGSVVFTPQSGFVGTTRTVEYRFANTDGDVAEGELSVAVTLSTTPGGGDDGGSDDPGAGGSGGSGQDSDPLATTGVNALAYAGGALTLLALGAVLAFRGRLRRQRATATTAPEVASHD